MKEPTVAEKCADLLKALADEGRLRIMQALRERSQSVSDLAALLDNDIKNVSHHLKVLRRQGLVENRREGKTIIYSLSEQVRGVRRAASDRLELGCCSLDMRRD